MLHHRKLVGAILSLSGIALQCLILNACAPTAVGPAGEGMISAPERRTTGALVEDEAIELKAQSLFRNEKGIGDRGHVNVISYNGNVLLVGQVPTEDAKVRAEEILDDFTKVRKVFNELSIAAPSSYLARASDALITSKIKSKIIAEKTLVASRIKVVTENGIVYLMGIVTQAEAHTAIEIARHTGGVQRVVPLFEVM